MPLKINQNIFSTLIQRTLTRTETDLTRSYERLASGERINSAADDPSGLAQSDRLRYSMRAMRQNQQNVSGATSLIGLAESQLGSVTDMLQRVRELALQAANVAYENNRGNIQAEIDQLLNEIDRIANTTRYGDQVLLNGTLENKSIQVGEDAGEKIQLSLRDFRVASLGARAEMTSASTVDHTAIALGDILINNVRVPASAHDGVSYGAPAASGLAKARAINEIEGQTGVHAEAEPTRLIGSSPVTAVNIDGVNRKLEINGVGIVADVHDGDAGGVLLSAINAAAGQTGVRAAIDGDGRLVLTAEDGRNITISTAGDIADELGLSGGGDLIDLTVTSRVTLTSTRQFSIEDLNGRLGTPLPMTTYLPEAATALLNVDVTTTDGAAAAVRSVDAAIEQVSDGRSLLGAVSNRLEDLTSALARGVEELSTADSRIRDTDFAYETARLTQAQILQEAGIAMLAQANVTPRKALELLRG